MAVCPIVEQCPLYPTLEMRSLQTFKFDYCERDFDRCERFRRNRDGRIVPMNLLPNGQTLGAAPAQAAAPAEQRKRS